ncbi:MAG: MFS transporter [Verrucomicrobiae bacterium]|nr:MFS transporter [Verrucomicrobiae bacterium]
MPATTSLWDRAYDRLFSEKPGARACDDLTDEACAATPGNFFASIAALTLTKLGDAIASPKTVLTWLLTMVGAPVAIIGWLVPVRESLSMLPQIVLAGWIGRFALRKWIWIVAGFAQGAALVGMGIAAWNLRGAPAGLVVLGCLIVFSLARAFGSISIKDLQGKTIAKRRRGRVTGWSAALAGGLTMLGSLVLIGPLRETTSTGPFGWILFLAAALFLAGAIVFMRVREFPGETLDASGSPLDSLRQARKNLHLLAAEPGFRRFVIARALFLVSALSAPYYVVLARASGGETSTGIGGLGWFVLAGGIADMVSSPLWGHFADRSSRRVMMVASGLASALGLAIFTAHQFASAVIPTGVWPWVVAYFFLSVAHAGVRAGRKTYVVDMATGNRRTDFVSVSNTVIGLILILTGLLTPLADHFGPAWFILFLSLAGIVGIALAAGLPEVEEPDAG